ncbi:MAG: hypothetical protein KDB27_28295 [Planctomycetales bacterium]|nr:hypothetical protein [Planctomycetales bacterium]
MYTQHIGRREILLARTVFAVIVVLLTAPSISAAQEWATLSGRFLYPPELSADANARNDKELVVNPKNNGLANVAVWMYRRGKDLKPLPDEHPDYKAAMEHKKSIAFANGNINSQIFLLRTGQPLEVINNDAVAYDPSFTFQNLKNKPINRPLPPGERFQVELKHAEPLPVLIQCAVHPHLHGRLLVMDHPYMSYTDKDGKFEIKNVPRGEWTFQFWHSKTGYVRNVKRGTKEEHWHRGRLKIDLTADKDLGDIEISQFRSAI